MTLAQTDQILVRGTIHSLPPWAVVDQNSLGQTELKRKNNIGSTPKNTNNFTIQSVL